MTVDEELNVLDDSMRRLKVEYDVYFGGGAKKPPVELEWRVQSLLKRFSDSQKLNFSERFKYNSIAQRYAIFSELWRQKLRIKEEGYRRPEDALLAIQGLRTEKERAAAKALKQRAKGGSPEPPPEFVVECGDVNRDEDKVRSLFQAMLEAKRRSGDADPHGRFEGFREFIRMKTDQIRREYQCDAVEFRVEVHDQRVRLKARAKP